MVHLTLPWGRGHVFRFRAVDDFAGLLYTHRWHLQEEPSEQANWNQNFSASSAPHADKWLKAIIFECDTYGVNKSVQVEVDGTVVQTLTVNANGRRVIQLALADQHLGRVWRMFPIDGNPGRLVLRRADLRRGAVLLRPLGDAGDQPQPAWRGSTRSTRTSR